VDVVGVELAAGVEHDQAVAGVDGVHRRHRDHRQHAGGDLLARPPEDRPDRVVDVDEVALTVPVPLGQLPDRFGGPHRPSVRVQRVVNDARRATLDAWMTRPTNTSS
jgi:hypothetical protein